MVGEEWQRREGQRQQLLRQKLEHYSSLERQLQEALEKVQAQQNQLSEKEMKVSTLYVPVGVSLCGVCVRVCVCCVSDSGVLCVERCVGRLVWVGMFVCTPHIMFSLTTIECIFVTTVNH